VTLRTHRARSLSYRLRQKSQIHSSQRCSTRVCRWDQNRTNSAHAWLLLKATKVPQKRSPWVFMAMHVWAAKATWS